jgi:hypothetical protein
VRAEVREARGEDIPALAATMRPADVAEVAAAVGLGPEAALRASLAASTRAWTGLIDDVPVVMFGVGPASILSGLGRPWMLAAEALERHPVTFLRRCRPCVAAMLAVYPSLGNYVDDRNTVSKRWLGWLGFRLAEGTVKAASGVAFRHFSMEG